MAPSTIYIAPCRRQKNRARSLKTVRRRRRAKARHWADGRGARQHFKMQTVLSPDCTAVDPPGVSSLRQSGVPASLCALIGFLSAFTFSIVGQMPIGEVILALIFPWV